MFPPPPGDAANLLDSLPEGALILHDAISAALAAHASTTDPAALAARIVCDVMSRCGGEYLYIPKGLRLQVQEKHRAIWHEFNGRNHKPLARKYRLSLQAVYRIIADMQAKDLAERNRPCFNATNR